MWIFTICFFFKCLGMIIDDYSWWWWWWWCEWIFTNHTYYFFLYHSVMVWGWLSRCDPAWSAWWFCLGCLLFFLESWRWRVSIGCANNRIYIGWISLLISVVLHFSRSSSMSRLAGWWLQFDFLYFTLCTFLFGRAVQLFEKMRVVWDWDSHYGW